MVFKKKYFFYIDDLRNINLNLIKKKYKFNIIYRTTKKTKNYAQISKFVKECKRKDINFIVANDIRLALKVNADGIYFSSYNNSFLSMKIDKEKNFKIYGSAHNFKEINQKIKQGCKNIIFSRLFKTEYEHKKNYYGLIKFNLITQKFHNYLIPLGGIRLKNLKKIKIINCQGIALFSEIKKKPAIIRRLF